jgi:hypothetical protein
VSESRTGGSIERRSCILRRYLLEAHPGKRIVVKDRPFVWEPSGMCQCLHDDGWAYFGVGITGANTLELREVSAIEVAKCEASVIQQK